MEKLIRVVVVDDHLVSRKGIIALLESNSNIEVVAEGSAGNHVLELLDEYHPDILITDLLMPAHADEGKSGNLFEPVSTLQQVIRSHPSTSVIVNSQEHDVQTIQSLAEVGVRGYLLKTDDFTKVLGQAVELIHNGTVYFSPEVQEIIYSAPRVGQSKHLTPQQLNVLLAIIHSPDMPRAELAESLHISKSTLQKHISAIFAALEVHTMESCILKAMRMGLIDIDTSLR